MIVTIHQPNYLPWLGFFDKMAQADLFVLLDNVQYVRQGFQGRTKIKSPQGAFWLTVPLHYHQREKLDIRDIEIDDTQDWKTRHLQCLTSAYGKAPYFAQYAQRFGDLYSREWNRLGELNIAAIELLADAMGIETPCVISSDLEGLHGQKSELIVSVCKAVGADEYLSGPSGRNYIDEDVFRREGVTLRYQEFEHPVYEQRFGEFIPAMSAVDALFCCGAQIRDRLVETRALARETAGVAAEPVPAVSMGDAR